MILHLFHNDSNTAPQFITYVVEQFSKLVICSEFIVMTGLECESDLSQSHRLRCVNPEDENAILILLESLKDYSAIVFHGLFYPWCETVLRSVPEQVKVAWMFWGGEVYFDKNCFLAPVTKAVYNLRQKVKYKDENSWHLPVELYQRIDYCLTGVQEEYEYVKRWAHTERMQHIWYTYYSIEETVGCLMDSSCDGDNVWICNSAAVENNVYDVVAFLLSPNNRKYMKNRAVIMPLSYGAKWVRNTMVRIGPIAFPSGFTPLLDFLPRPEYNQLMLSCSTMVLFYYRPAGQGNIITALWLGMRVYLSEKSMILPFFKRLGIVIFSFESDFSRFGCEKMLVDDVEKNRSILLEYYGRKHIDRACMDVIKALA